MKPAKSLMVAVVHYVYILITPIARCLIYSYDSVSHSPASLGRHPFRDTRQGVAWALSQARRGGWKSTVIP